MSRAIVVALGLSVAALVAAAEPVPAPAPDRAAVAAAASETGTPEFIVRVVGQPKGPRLSGEALERGTEEVSHEVRCPVCQGSTIGDSPSGTARHMKQQVRDMLAAGFTSDQVLVYFEASYGEFVRLAPKAGGFTLLVWLVPVLLLVVGGFAAVAWLRRRTREAVPAPATVAGAAPPPDDPELDPWLRRVRALNDDGSGESR